MHGKRHHDRVICSGIDGIWHDQHSSHLSFHPHRALADDDNILLRHPALSTHWLVHGLHARLESSRTFLRFSDKNEPDDLNLKVALYNKNASRIFHQSVLRLLKTVCMCRSDV